MEEKVLDLLKDIKKELQDIRSTLKPKEIKIELNDKKLATNFLPEDSDGICDGLNSCKCSNPDVF